MLENFQQEVQLCRSLAPLVDALLSHITRSTLEAEYQSWLSHPLRDNDHRMKRLVALAWGETDVLLFAAPTPRHFVLAVGGDEFRVMASIVEGLQGATNQMRISELAGATTLVDALVTHLVQLLQGTTIGALAGGVHTSLPSA